MKIHVPVSPIAPPLPGRSRITAAILSLALIAASLFSLTFVLVTKSMPSPLAEQISVFAETLKLDAVLTDSINYLKIAYNLKHKED